MNRFCNTVFVIVMQIKLVVVVVVARSHTYYCHGTVVANNNRFKLQRNAF